ncbi:MAG: dihydrofolate reductase [Anaerovoracaceae bacterium]|nr:dihydrofolate reductase [Anaerovoracaceae bacterium]
MQAIVAVDKNWGIGNGGKLLARFPGDMKFFRDKTVGKSIVVGRKTLESFPDGKPLPDRNNIVLTGNEAYAVDGCTVCCGKETLLRFLEAFPRDDIFVCGGESVYRELLPEIDSVWVTKIDHEYEADRHFPDLDADSDFEITWKSETLRHKGIKYRFYRYERKKD